ncbi:MAG: carboxypeptidase regulatory-like domain-containing protein [Gemmatimonadota bacterium]|nr:carboxypeptidase regulatory-like domain-containing protein [Gemmatimonadota bacterium]
MTVGRLMVRLAGAGALSWLALAPRPCAAQRPGPRTPGTIGGRVVDSLLQPLAGATVTLDSAGRAVRTDSSGEFHLAGVAAGLHAITIRRIGYLPARFLIPVTPGNATYWTYPLARPPTALPTVTSKGIGPFGIPDRLAYTMKYDEFYERRKYAASGTFFAHEDIERMNVMDLLDVLRRIPNFKIVSDPDGTTIGFPTCKNEGVTIEIDGHRVWGGGGAGSAMLPPQLQAPSGSGSGGAALSAAPDPMDQLGAIRVNNVEAIEAYPTSSSLPAEVVGDACAAIFIWTR